MDEPLTGRTPISGVIWHFPHVVQGTLLVFSLLTACDAPIDEGIAGWEGEIRDSAGVLVVANPVSGLWGNNDRWAIEEDLVIGLTDGDPDYQFGHIVDLDVGGDGSVYILDQFSGTVRVYGPDGALRHSIGRSGQGPGELLGRGAVAVVIGAADRVLVPDWANQRVNIFSLAGDPLGEFRIPREAGIPIKWYPLSNGSFVQQQFSPRWDGLLRRGSSGAVEDTVVTFKYDRSVIGDRRLIYPLPALPAWTVISQDRVTYGVNDRYRLTVLSEDGSVERIITKEHGCRRLAEEEIAALAALHRDALEREIRAPVETEQVLERMVLPECLPAFADISTGPSETIWVQQVADPFVMGESVSRFMMGLVTINPGAIGSTEWDVFDSKGRYLGEVTLPRRFRLLKAEGMALWGVVEDEFGIQRVVRLRVRLGGS